MISARPSIPSSASPSTSSTTTPRPSPPPAPSSSTRAPVASLFNLTTSHSDPPRGTGELPSLFPPSDHAFAHGLGRSAPTARALASSSPGPSRPFNLTSNGPSRPHRVSPPAAPLPPLRSPYATIPIPPSSSPPREPFGGLFTLTTARPPLLRDFERNSEPRHQLVRDRLPPARVSRRVAVDDDQEEEDPGVWEGSGTKRPRFDGSWPREWDDRS